MWTKIKAAWRWSRTVFLNVAAGLAMLLAEFLPHMLGFQWSLFADPKVAALIVLGLNAMNVYLRFLTHNSVGKKDT